MAAREYSEEERVAICQWLTANGVDPETVPMRSALSVLEDNGVKDIHYEEYVLTEGGNKQIDPLDDRSEWTRDATAPCKVDPPAWLRIAGTV